MDCTEVLKCLYAFIDDELEECCCVELREHLLVCDACRCHVAFERVMLLCIQKHKPKEKAPQRLKNKIMKHIRHSQ